jgi:protein-S-isoprenylcysteine O-methyltransferase Ste14
VTAPERVSEHSPLTARVTFARAAFYSLSASLFLGLAIAGRGGFAPFFSEPALVALAATVVVLSGVALFSQGTLSSGVREDRSNRWVIPTLLSIGVLGAYVPAWTDAWNIWNLHGELVRWLGVVLFAAGGVLRIWPVFVLGRRFSALVAIQPGHTLVTTGIYGIVRNPSYLGVLVSASGWALAFRSMIGLVATLLVVPVLVARIRAEEALLRSQFGIAYDAYCARTPRLIPKLY